jgi:hypothetical protein
MSFRLVAVTLLQLTAGFAMMSDAAAATLPDPATGEINGTIALLLWPVSPDASRQPLPAEGCEVHLTLSDSQTNEMRYPCSAWFQPPGRGRYLVWLEQAETVSPQTFIAFDYLRFRGLGQTILMPMRAAGWLRVDAPKMPDGSTVRVLSLEESAEDVRAFDRRIPASQGGVTVRVPAGRAIAGVFDSTGRALALSRPVQVKKGNTTTVVPNTPQNADVLVSLIRRNHKRAEACRSAIVFSTGSEQPAEATLVAWDRVVAVWYGLKSTEGRVFVDCGSSKFEKEIQLARSKVITIRDELH